MLININDYNLTTIETICQDIKHKYFLDILVDAAWPVTLIIVMVFLYFPIKRLIDSLANNLGKAKEITISGVTWKTIDLEKAVTDLEILKAIVTTAYIDEDMNDIEIRMIVNRIKNMTSYIDHISTESKERILIESINIAGIDKVIDPEEYILLRVRAKSLNVDFAKIDELLLNECIIRNIMPPVELAQALQMKKEEYSAKSY